MEKILEINDDPVIRAFTYHTFPLSILSSSRYVGEKKVELQIRSNSEYEIQTTNAEYQMNGDALSILANEYEQDVRGKLLFKLSHESDIQLNIDYFQYTQPHAYLSIAICDECESKNVNEVRFYRNGKVDIEGWTCDKQNVINNVFLDSVHLMVQGKKIEIETQDKCNEVQKYEVELGDCIENCMIVFETYLGENQYYNWLFSNYIQLFGRNVFQTSYFCDYYIAPERENAIMYTIHSFLEFHHIDKSVLKRCKVDLITFVKANIDSSNYVEIILNHNEFLEKDRKKKPFLHQALVYGYSDEQGCIYIETIARDGKPKVSSISYEVFLKAADVDYERIVVIKYDTPENYYRLDVNKLKESLSDYLTGKDYNQSFSYILQKDTPDYGKDFHDVNRVEEKEDYLVRRKNVYGHNVYKYFLEDEQLFEYLLKDIRIPYIWKEHSTIMLERIKFLEYRHKISHESGNELIAQALEVQDRTQKIFNTCMKYNIRPSEKIEKNIRGLLEKYIEEDQLLIEKLIISLHE